MAAIVNLNGNITDEAHAVISVFDHGFLYGEGVYETLRTYHGQPFLFDRHMHRLRRSADMLALPIPLTDDEIDARFRDTMRAAGLDGGPNREAYLRMLVTRGVGDLSYDLGVVPVPIDRRHRQAAGGPARRRLRDAASRSSSSRRCAIIRGPSIR